VIKVDERSSGSSVVLARGAELELALAENPLTGFRWHVTRDPAPLCVPAGDKFIPGKRTGEGGIHLWRWRAAKPGTAELALDLLRRWETRPTRTFAIRIVVR
jgi:predicted secreted protein